MVRSTIVRVSVFVAIAVAGLTVASMGSQRIERSIKGGAAAAHASLLHGEQQAVATR